MFPASDPTKVKVLGEKKEVKAPAQVKKLDLGNGNATVI